ncbi:KID repeat-containing protein [Metarhizium acridum CQMa 102]|uniref:KID repeat-containing protein n=1 Tax=Metarhizium acridum (strain CQMa 102) TaxID=655827 RepID=E9E2D7_METAQ|nr:KID repeat-containing protein [Metarhizium acridum CQMa 102]EFY89826.1 KID repeat-containing protein [Metarhizium acridum CQMa 102]
MDNTSEQPNFARAADALAREVQLCPNIQVVQNAAILNRILIELGALRQTMETRFDAVDKRLDAVEKRLDAVEKRLDAVEKRLDTVEKRLETLEQSTKVADM